LCTAALFGLSIPIFSRALASESRDRGYSGTIFMERSSDLPEPMFSTLIQMSTYLLISAGTGSYLRTLTLRAEPEAAHATPVESKHETRIKQRYFKIVLILTPPSY
jgi:hypothetical protein